MNNPAPEWTSLRLWAAENRIDYEIAKQEALSSLEIEYMPTIDGGLVRFNPLEEHNVIRVSLCD